MKDVAVNKLELDQLELRLIQEVIYHGEREHPLERALTAFESSHLGYTSLDIEVNLYFKDQDDVIYAGVQFMKQWQVAKLQSLWVTEVLRKKGIGTILLKHAEDIAKELGCDRVMLEMTSMTNVSFYLSQGYAILSHLQEYLPGYDYYQLTKQIPGKIDEQ